MTVRASRAAQPAVAADRCAREIIGFLTSIARARGWLNGNPLGRNPSMLYHHNSIEVSYIEYRCY
jgi:hypothetical protein